VDMVDGYRTFTSPGHLMRVLFQGAQVNGWGPNVTWNFTDTLDSNGVAWTAAELPPRQRALQPIATILNTLVEQGLVEWDAQGQQVRLYRPGRGTDRSGTIKLGGPGFERAPSKSAFDVFTRLTVILGGLGYNDNENVTNVGADNRFGELWAIQTQADTISHTEAARLAAPALAAGRDLKRELSYDWTPNSMTPLPLYDFTVGDVVKCRVEDGWMTQRVVGVVLAKNTEGVTTARAVVGDKMLSAVAKLTNRAEAATVGQIIQGGAGIPAVPPPTLGLTPKAPTGLVVETNESVALPDGDVQTHVKLNWANVTQATDNSTITIQDYEVWARRGSELSTLLQTVPVSELHIYGWEPLVDRYVKVRARAVSGALSAFTTEVAVTPVATVARTPAAPTGLAVSSNVGSFQGNGSTTSRITLTWNAVTLDDQGVGMSIQDYEVQIKDGTAWVPFAPVTGTTISFDITAGTTRDVKVRARSTLGVWGNVSGVVSVTGNQPATPSSTPSTPTLSSSLGMVLPVWDGLIGGSAPPSSFQHLITQRAPASSGPWTDVGVPATRAGQTATLRETVGSTVWVRFRWVDTVGRLANASSAVSIVVTGVTGPDIAANTVTANNMTVGSIEVQHLASGVGAAIDLSANGSVTTIVTQQSELAAQAAAAAATAAEAAVAAQEAADLAGTAEAQADAATAAAAAVEAANAATQAQLDLVKTWFKVDGAGAHVGQTGNPFQANVLPGEFNITENGVKRTWLTGGQLYAPALTTESVGLSNHKFEKFGTGTVIRSLG
jgi:hypothetical protein